MSLCAGVLAAPGLFGPGQYLVEETGRGFLDEVEHALETDGSTVIRIRHVLDLARGGEFREQPDPFTICRGAAIEQDLAVQPVHRHDQVEALEVACLDDARTLAAEIDSAPARSLDRPGIGRVADVVVVRPGRVDFDVEVRGTLANELAEDALGRGRSTYISHAHEQYLHTRTF